MSTERRRKTDITGAGCSASRAKRMSASTRTKAGARGTRCLQALVVAVDQASDTAQWYTVTKQLQLVSLELCQACRAAHTFHLRVDDDTPTTLLATVDDPHPTHEEGLSSRVPRLRARRVTWELPSLHLLGSQIEAFTDMEALYFDSAFNGSLAVRAWPSRLRIIDMDDSSLFNQPIGGVVWPQSLQDLTFGSDFNQPIEGVKWPTSLVRIELRGAFNQPIEGVKWPASLRQIELRGAFNKPIEAGTWPASLQKLRFGQDFNQPVERVTWPTSLRQLAFGRDFNQPIGGEKWPTSLEELELGENFDQPIHGTKWPSLRRLRLTGAFRHSLQCLGSTMPALERFALYFRDKARYSLLRGMEWPALLTHLEVCANAKLDGVSIPSHVSLVSS